MNVAVKIDETLAKRLEKIYQKYQVASPSPYVTFFAKFGDTTISVFKSKKDKYSLTITSSKKNNIKKILTALKINEYIVEENKRERKQKASNKFVYLDDQIGSDEVGTGDFLGPIVVVASLVKNKDLNYLKELGVMDSKKLDDKKIRQIGKIAIHKFPYSLLTLDNAKYNALIKKGYNINQIKVLLHNQALYNMCKKFPHISNVYVDEFTNKKNYYNYLKNSKNVVKNIYFHTKGESYFPSVALSSVIARYAFLTEMDKLNKKYHTIIPFGANEYVDSFSKEFIKKYGNKEFDKIAKQNFKNYQRVIV